MNGLIGWMMGLLAVIPGLGAPAAPSWNGYVEDDYVYAAAPTAGTIASLPVAEGQMVKKGEVLFGLDASQQQAQYDAAKAQANAAQATLANLQTGGRPEELAVGRAALQKALSDLDLAQQNATRTQSLFAQGLATQAQLDQAKAAVGSAQAVANQAQAQVKVTELPARDAQQIAAEASFAAAEATADAAKATLDDRTVLAPEDARIDRLFYKAGEVAGAGAPVASLSGAAAMKVIFYVNEADRPQFKLGDVVRIGCDGCAAGLTATISHFDSSPQFTPPIIYSRDERNRLVFETEATLVDQNGILPGQPVTIERGDD
jgi:HlyD family secretion protein